MRSQASLDAAARMGARAGQSFLDTGVWPLCPFTSPALADLSAAWGHALFEVVGPVIAPKPRPAAGGAAV